MVKIAHSNDKNEKQGKRDSKDSYAPRKTSSREGYRRNSRDNDSRNSYSSRSRGSFSDRDRRSSRDNYSSGRTSDRRSYGDSSRSSRDSDRGSKRGLKNRRDFEMTKVICDSCGAECEVPFKPTSNKPIYCDKCFAKRDKPSFDKPHFDKAPSKDLEIINKKLDKIMKALDIE